jgi:hypothetical protein
MATVGPPAPAAPSQVIAPLGWFSSFRLAFGRAWQSVRDITTILHPCRFSVFVVAAGAALLLATPQGRELAVGLPDGVRPDWGLLRVCVAFHLCVLLWAFESWYWSRLMLDVTYGLERECDKEGNQYARHVCLTFQYAPRVIALAAYVVAGIALALAHAWWNLAAAAVVGVLFYRFLVRRLTLTDRLHAKFGAPAKRLLGEHNRQVWRLRDLPPFSMGVLVFSFVLALLCTALVLHDAVGFGWGLGAAAVPFLGFALIVPVGSLLVYWSRMGGALDGTLRVKAYPVVTTLVLWALLVGTFVDNHAVRTSPPIPAGTPGPAARDVLPQAALRWQGVAARVAGSESPPLVIVATAGGGLRAAYWTATVLGRLQDEAPNFRTYLFGVSGVSGGSLGAAVFVTLLADGAPAPGASCRSNGVDRKAFECAGQAVLARDFLGPTAASMLFPDLMQRFIPAPVFPEDRAATLEQAWERAWGRAGLPRAAWTRRTFTGLWRESGAHLPSLFLNGTHVETGKRIITSNLKIDGAAFRDTYDFFALVSGDILLSTAAHNSARFSYVSPAGTMRENGQGSGHIVDGGYFENFGAVTAQDALRAALAALQDAGKPPPRLVLIQISNDPGLELDDLEVDRIEGPTSRPPNWWGNETLSPPRTLLKTRDARGILAYKEFLREAPHERRAHFRLCKEAGEPALGWVLAKQSLDVMHQAMRNDPCGNQAELERILKAIRS